MHPPLIYLQPVWQYKHIVRPTRKMLDEAELNGLGAEGWELVGVVSAGRAVHFYFKGPER